MRKISLLLFLTLLVSCSEELHIDYSTSEVLEEPTLIYPNKFIGWDSLLTQKEENYFVYVFSYDCYYCKEMKKRILCFYDTCGLPMYFIEYSKVIPIGHNTSNTLGKSNIDDIFIKGTPTLFLINKGIVTFNMAGVSEVNQLIDLYLKK